MKNRFKFWVIRQVFNHYYSSFEYPFIDVEEKIRKLPAAARRRYYIQIKEFTESKAYKIEISGLLQKFYRDLAVKPTTPETIAGYRLCLTFINRFEARLLSLSRRGAIDQATDNALEDT